MLLYLAGVLCVAGLVHIVSILMMPHVAAHDAYQRFAALAKPGKTTLLPYRHSPVMKLNRSRIQPWRKPVCLYDLADGPLHVHADLPDNTSADDVVSAREPERFFIR